MEISEFRSFADLGMSDDLDLFLEQWPVDELSSEINDSSFPEDLHQHSRNSDQHPLPLNFERAASQSSEVEDNTPLKELQTTTWNPYEPGCVLDSTTSSNVRSTDCNKAAARYSYSGSLTFSSQPTASESSSVHQYYQLKRPCQRVVDRMSTRTFPDQAREHSLAERKRRAKLSQRFIALSTLIPGLKKMDKLSVLGDAIDYMKQLQEKVKTLEEQTNKTTIESVVFAVKKYGDHEKSSSNEIIESLPQIEARFCNKEVLISIHCEKRKGVLQKIVAEIEKFHLTVVNSSVMAYGDSALNITVIAEKNQELTMSVKELVKNLGDVLQIFM